MIDYSGLPDPQLVEELNYELILQSMIADLRVRDPSYTEILESDPGVKILEVCAARELILRQRVNDAFRATLLRYAGGADLENLAAFYNVLRLDGEVDDDFRRRVIERIMGSSAAGGVNWYRYHALTASPYVKDVHVESPGPGEVTVAILSSEGQDAAVATGDELDQLGVMWGIVRDPGESDATYRARILALVEAGGGYGAASTALISLVDGVLQSDNVRPVTDKLTVVGAETIGVDVVAYVYLYPQTPTSVFDALPGILRDQFDAASGLGWDVTTSWIIGALMEPGVQRVEIVNPPATVVCDANQAPTLDTINLTFAGRDR